MNHLFLYIGNFIQVKFFSSFKWSKNVFFCIFFWIQNSNRDYYDPNSMYIESHFTHTRIISVTFNSREKKEKNFVFFQLINHSIFDDNNEILKNEFRIFRQWQKRWWWWWNSADSNGWTLCLLWLVGWLVDLEKKKFFQDRDMGKMQTDNSLFRWFRSKIFFAHFIVPIIMKKYFPWKKRKW